MFLRGDISILGDVLKNLGYTYFAECAVFSELISQPRNTECEKTERRMT